jgi:hypothetical protein
MELAAQLPEAAIEILDVERERPRQSHEREEVAVAADRQNAAAIGAEVLVDRSTRTAAAAFECGNRT